MCFVCDICDQLLLVIIYHGGPVSVSSWNKINLLHIIAPNIGLFSKNKCLYVFCFTVL